MLLLFPDLSEAQTRFSQEFRVWIEGVQERKDAALLGALTKIITYETNRPYYYWYEELRPIQLTPEEVEKIREIAKASDEGEKGIRERTEIYLKKAFRHQVLSE